MEYKFSTKERTIFDTIMIVVMVGLISLIIFTVVKDVSEDNNHLVTDRYECLDGKQYLIVERFNKLRGITLKLDSDGKPIPCNLNKD